MKQSPRVEDDILKFYIGDTFPVQFEFFEETEEGDVAIEFAEDEKIFLRIYKNASMIMEILIEYLNGNVATVIFDESMVSLLNVGKYTYYIERVNGYVSKLLVFGNMEVERVV